MSTTWKGEVSRTILNIFRSYNGIDVLILPCLEELYEKTFVVPYVIHIVNENLLFDVLSVVIIPIKP